MSLSSIEFNPNLPPNLAKRFKIVKFLAKGSFGQVFLTQEIKNPSKKFATKFIKIQPDSNFGIAENTIGELSILTRLDHPNIIKMYDLEYDARRGVVALVLELADNDLSKLIQYWFDGSVAEILQRKNKQIQHQLQITYDIFCGLNYLHKNGIIHLDMKPENVLIVNSHAKIADFGLSDRFESSKGASIKGSTLWMSPEMNCWSGLYDFNADTWSVGVMMCEIFFNHVLLGKKNNFPPEEFLFRNILDTVGIPSVHWSEQYRKSESTCPLDRELDKSLYYNLEKSIFRNNVELLRFYKEKYYGPKLYRQILDLIGQCLRFTPSDRIQFDQVVKLFKNQPCNCTSCVVVAGYHIPLSAPKLYHWLEKVVGSATKTRQGVLRYQGEDAVILPYAREIFSRFQKKQSKNKRNNKKQDSLDKIQYQAASLSIAAKMLSVADEELEKYRLKWIELAKIDTFQHLNKLELEIATKLSWNFDGPT